MTFLRKSGAVTLLALAALITFFIGLCIWGAWHDEWTGFNASLEYSDGWCNVAVIPLAGHIVATGAVEGEVNADDVVASLRKAESDTDVKAVLLRIDSVGGSPVASETIMQALKASPLPSLALIREMGTSGAYLAATGADTIYASEYSDVASIGVTMSYLENVEQNKQEGLDFVSLSSARFKDYMNPNASLTEEERALLERDLDIYHRIFVREVSENRGLPLEAVQLLADGSSMPGALGLENKLVDALGGQGDTRGWFAEQLGIAPEEVIFCE
jgi:protease-4